MMSSKKKVLSSVKESLEKKVINSQNKQTCQSVNWIPILSSSSWMYEEEFISVASATSHSHHLSFNFKEITAAKFHLKWREKLCKFTLTTFSHQTIIKLTLTWSRKCEISLCYLVLHSCHYHIFFIHFPLPLNAKKRIHKTTSATMKVPPMSIYTGHIARYDLVDILVNIILYSSHD